MKTMIWMLSTIHMMVVFSLAAAAPASSKGQYNDNPPYNFHGEIDKTDIFAIPLDNSEEEQDEELESFEKYSEEHKKQK